MKRFGKKVYSDDDKIKKEVIGYYVCPVCKKESKLIHQSCPSFENVLSICEKKHTVELTITLKQKYQVGDRIRHYESTFGKDSVLRLDSYTEGVIIKSYPFVTSYQFDYVVDKCVMNGHEIKAPAWIIGHVVEGVNHSDNTIKLLKKADNTKLDYEQLSFDLG